MALTAAPRAPLHSPRCPSRLPCYTLQSHLLHTSPIARMDHGYDESASAVWRCRGPFTSPRKTRPTGRARMNFMVDPGLLARAAQAVGPSNKSEVVNLALARLVEDEAIMTGLNAAFGALPDFPRDDAP